MDTVNYLNAVVWATIQPSKIDGVGVFAIRDIKKGTQITDYSIHNITDVGIIRLTEEEMNSVVPEVRKLILDRSCFQEGQKNLYFVCPNMEICLTSFMNHAVDANSDGKFALRDIKKGEEITENYSTLFNGKNPHPLIREHYSFLW